MEVYCTETLIIIRRYFSQWPFVPFPSVGEHLLKDLVYSFLTYSANHRLQIFKSNDSGINTITLNLLERITRGRQFSKRENDHFPEISEKSKKRPFSPEFSLENGRIVATETSDLYSRENVSEDHRKHRGKCENSGFSPALQMDQFSLKIGPENEKTDRRSGR